MTTHLEDVEQLSAAWEKFQQATHIKPIRSEEQYESMLSKLDTLWDLTRGDEDHQLWDLCELVSNLVHAYEDANHPLLDAKGVDALRFLMQEHGLCQGDLPEVGSQGVVSEILSGRRDLNVRQIEELSNRFGVSPATFIG